MDGSVHNPIFQTWRTQISQWEQPNERVPAIKNAFLHIAPLNCPQAHPFWCRGVLGMEGISGPEFGFFSTFSGGRSQIRLLLILGSHKIPLWLFTLPCFCTLCHTGVPVYPYVLTSLRSESFIPAHGNLNHSPILNISPRIIMQFIAHELSDTTKTREQDQHLCYK